MICPPCRVAGVYNSLRPAEAPTWVGQGATLRYAADLHTQCLYPHTCTCQHHLGDVRSKRGDG